VVWKSCDGSIRQTPSTYLYAARNTTKTCQKKRRRREKTPLYSIPKKRGRGCPKIPPSRIPTFRYVIQCHAPFTTFSTPNLVIRETLPTPSTKVMCETERGCRFGPAHVYAHRSPTLPLNSSHLPV
jgi:hypothetical protein